MNDSINTIHQVGRSESRPLRAHAVFITVFMLSAALTALGLTYIYSERYAGETTIFFKPANILKLSESQVRALGSPVPYTPFKVISQTLSGLAKSDSLLRQVVLDLSLQVPERKTISPIWYIRMYKEAKDWISDCASDAWSLVKYGRVITPDPTDEAIWEVRRGLKILNEDSYVFSVTARAKSPETAAAVANQIAGRLSDLLRQEDLVAADKQRQQIRSLLTANSDEITRLEQEIRDLLLSNRVASVQAAIEHDTESYSKLELSRADARAELSQQEARLAGLVNKIRQQVPMATLESTRNGLTPQQSLGRLTTTEYSTLSVERQATEVSVGGLRNRVSSYDQTAAQMEQQLAKLTRLQAEYGVLSQRLESAKREYVALRDVLAEAAVKAGDFQSEIRVTSPATEVNMPVSPIKVYHVGLATLVAAMLACGLAYVLSYFDVRLFIPRSRQGSEPPGLELEPTGAIRTSRSVPTSAT